MTAEDARQQELDALIAEQAVDMAGRHDYWPAGVGGRREAGWRAASMEEMEATHEVDVWEDPTADAALEGMFDG